MVWTCNEMKDKWVREGGWEDDGRAGEEKERKTEADVDGQQARLNTQGIIGPHNSRKRSR